MMARQQGGQGNAPRFRRGEFKPYRATRKIHLGPTKGDIGADEIVEFDGYTLRLSDGGEFRLPNVRGAVDKGWLVDPEDEHAQYQAQPAGIMMSPADTTKDQQAHRVGRVQRSNTQQVVGSYQGVRQAGRTGSNLVTQPSADGPPIVTIDHGVEVAKIGNPTHTKSRVGSAQFTSNEVNRIDRRGVNVHIRNDLQGKGSDERFLTDEDRAIIAEKRAKREAAEAIALAEAEQRRLEGAAAAKRAGYRAPLPQKPSIAPLPKEVDPLEAKLKEKIGAAPSPEGMHPEVFRALNDLYQTKRQLALEELEAEGALEEPEPEGPPPLSEAEKAQIEALTQARLELERKKLEMSGKKQLITTATTASAEELKTLDEAVNAAPIDNSTEAGEYEEGWMHTIVTGNGEQVVWDTKTLRWAARVKKAKEDFGKDRIALLGIADIEIDAVAKRLRQHAATLPE